MATEEQVSEQGVGLGPQTPAARRRARALAEEAPEPRDEGIGPTTPVARELAEIEEARPEIAAAGAALENARPELEEAGAELEEAGADLQEAGAETEWAGVETEEAGGGTDETAAVPEVAAAVTEVAAAVTEETAAASAEARPGPPPGAALAALVTLGSSLTMLLLLISSVGSPRGQALPTAGFQATPSLREVAPGGRIVLSGSGAPANAQLTLETRTSRGEWHAAGHAMSDAEGGFLLSGRIAAAPGTVMVRARAPEEASSAPVGVTVRPLRLSSVGDINLGDVPGAGIAAEGPHYPWTSVGRRLQSADIGFGNLECAVSKRGTPFEKLYNFRGTPAALRGLERHSGIDVLNLANNHAGDYGPVALLDTVRGIERLGMKAVGAGRNLRRALEPQVVERLGLRVAFVGFSDVAPIEFAAAAGRPGTAWATPEAVTESVHRARRRADVVVATFHWGIEKAPDETGQQQALAAAAAAAGAQLVIGAHPHVLQPLRRQGSALVAYSLGNFVFGAVSEGTTATGILETDLTSEGVAKARWRPGEIAGGRPLLHRQQRPRRLPVGDAEAMAAGVRL
jgi:poly-gamma-glutamate capsule biosynthesis protein CapA/YwtB (metallophosphatase superfamily)